MNKNIAPKIIALLSAGIITITNSFSIVNLYLKEKSKQDLQNQKSYTQILKDAEGFGADFKVVEN